MDAILPAQTSQYDVVPENLTHRTGASKSSTTTPPSGASSAESFPENSSILSGLQETTALSNPIRTRKDTIKRSAEVLNLIAESGIRLDEPTLKAELVILNSSELLSKEQLMSIQSNSFMRKIIQKDLAISDFPHFKSVVKDIFETTAKEESGGVATYIPQLAAQNPKHWAVAACSVDGQQYALGDCDVPFCVQSCCKPLTYCMALEINGEHIVHQHVGHEPSGRNFNDRSLMKQAGGKSVPHNPLINAGAIMAASLVMMSASEWDRYDYMLAMWQKLCGGKPPGFQNNTFMGERATAARNFTLAYMMEEEKAFPPGTDIIKTLEAYFSWCSIELDCRAMAVLASTLANGGICPLTNERIFTHETVTRCLSLMMSCGMYDYSGKFAFEVGIPAKSGVAGCVFIVIPGVCGLATFSPRLDEMGNSVRGIVFCRALSQRLQYHLFGRLPGLTADHISEDGGPMSPKRRSVIEKMKSGVSEDGPNHDEADVASLWWSAAKGDRQRIRQLAARGIDVNRPDYDKRSALHLAASEGHTGTVRLLLELSANTEAADLHNHNPLDDAVREHNDTVQRLLRCARRKSGSVPNSPQSVQPYLPGQADPLKYFADLSIRGPDGTQIVSRNMLIDALNDCGLFVDCDPRLQPLLTSLPDPFSETDFEALTRRMPIVLRALRGELVVPNFSMLSETLESLFSTMCAEGKELEYWSGAETLDIATVDGQVMHLGKDDRFLCADEVVSVVVFMVALEQLGLDLVKDFMTFEPSGESNDSASLNAEGLPYNPFMWNGMLALCSLLQEHTEDALQVVTNAWAGLISTGADEPVQFSEPWHLQDREKHLYRVTALIHKSLDLGSFPKKTPPDEVVSLFFQLRSILCTSENLCKVAACLAKGGQNPWTGKQICEARNGQKILSLMYSAGCETVSGEFSFKVGVPAKNSREGVILLAIPNLAGLCVASPALTWQGISKGGLKFCFDFAGSFNCHSLSGDSTSAAKYDPCLYHFHTDMDLCSDLINAAEMANIPQLRALINIGFDVSYSDYDGRCAAHVAAARGHVSVLKYLYKNSADIRAQDRWGITPMEEATRTSHPRAAATLNTMLNHPEYENSDGGSMYSSFSTADASSKLKSVQRSAAPVAAKQIGGLGSLQETAEDDEEADDDDGDIDEEWVSERKPTRSKSKETAAEAGAGGRSRIPQGVENAPGGEGKRTISKGSALRSGSKDAAEAGEQSRSRSKNTAEPGDEKRSRSKEAKRYASGESARSASKGSAV